MDINQFQDFLRDQIVKNVKGTRNESTSLLHWLLVNVFDIDEDHSKSIICDGNKDKGIDALYVDTVEEIIYVFQSKYKENNDRHIGDKVLRDFSGVKNWFQSAESVKSLAASTINPELKSLLEELKITEVINDYSVEYHFVSNAFLNEDTNEFLEVEPSIFVWDIESLQKHYHLIQDDPLVVDEHTFENISKDNVIEISLENGLKTAIVPIEASKLLELKGIEDMTLFSKNVRYGLGNTRVNKAIRETIKDNDESRNFILFHNGISMVCESFNYDKKKTSLCTKNYSVVNGAQSILTFYKQSKKLNENIKVLLRVTQVGDNKDLIDLISKYNNNQNAISMKDLRSKDKIQNRLTRQFAEFDKKYDTKISYSAKRGRTIPEDHELLLSDYAGQLIESCYLSRSYNVHLKASMFDARYNEIFSKNTDALKLIMYYNAHKVLKTIIDKIDDKGIADYGLAQHFLLMVLFDVLNSNPIIKEQLKSAEYYFESVFEWNEVFKNIMSTLIKGLNRDVRNLKEKEDFDFVYKNYFKSKENIQTLHNSVKAAFEGLLELNDSSIIDLVTTHGVTIK